MKTAFLFPGQGSQQVGMCNDIYRNFPFAKSLFDTAEEVTSLPIKKLCFEGPEEQLGRTDIAQPAIFTVSAVILKCMLTMLSPEQEIHPDCTAGLSLGEYTALYAAGAMDFETCLKLVAKRGELMQAAATATPSGMIAVIGLDEQKAMELCNAAAEGEILSCANFNCPGQIVLSGQKEACKRAEEKAKSFGASGAKMLNVAGAFHSKIMAPAAEKFAEVLDEVDFADPKIPVLSNVDAQTYENTSQIREKLLAQLTSPVRWEDCVKKLLAKGTEKFYEIGPGKVLSGLMRRINRQTPVSCINTQQVIEGLGSLIELK